MAQAYTPGLKRKEFCLVRKLRMLPLKGEVLVKKGDNVSSVTIVAKTDVPGTVYVVNAAGQLGIEAKGDMDYVGLGADIGGMGTRGMGGTLQVPQATGAKMEHVYDYRRYMLKKEGDHVSKGEAIGIRKYNFGLSSKICRSPSDGTIDIISEISGQVIIREPPVIVNINAYIPGTVVEVFPGEGASVETPAALIQGIFGVGAEAHGEIKVATKSASDSLTVQQMGDQCSGKILVGGLSVDADALRKAVELGVKGIIVGSIDDKDLSDFLGYEIGVAITGREDVGLTLILTEGFGKIRMSDKTFELLSKFNGRAACINGATQIRAGVVRPEIVIPRHDAGDGGSIELEDDEKLLKEGMTPGTPVRIIREPHFGVLGRVSTLPVDLQALSTESSARVVVVELEGGTTATVPRANVEIIEE